MQTTLRLPQELRHFENDSSELSLVENPYPFSRYEVWMTRVEWEEWRRLLATEDLSTAQQVFERALHDL